MASCSTCGAGLTGAFCAACGSAAGGQELAASEDPAVEYARLLTHRLRTERHGIPALLSFFIPGLGQMVKGQFLWGVGIFLAAAVFGAACVFLVGIPLLGVLWIWQVYEAYAKPDAALADEVQRVMTRRPMT